VAATAYFRSHPAELLGERKAKHVRGAFEPEVAWSRAGGGKGNSEEPLVIPDFRKHHQTHMFSQWIQIASRPADDAQSVVNVAAGGKLAHADVSAHFTSSCARGAHPRPLRRSGGGAQYEDAHRMLEVYRKFRRGLSRGAGGRRAKRAPRERFPGRSRKNIYTIEKPEGWTDVALQMRTSHFLGQNFAALVRKNPNMIDDQNQMQFVWQTVGVRPGLLRCDHFMTHGDARGLRLPPDRRLRTAGRHSHRIWRKSRGREKKVLAAAGASRSIN